MDGHEKSAVVELGFSVAYLDITAPPRLAGIDGAGIYGHSGGRLSGLAAAARACAQP